MKGKVLLTVLLVVLSSEIALAFRANARLVHRPLVQMLSNPMERDREELRAMREENDFLAFAQGSGLINEDEAGRMREAERRREKDEYDPSTSKFGSWMGGLMVGTPFSPEAGSEAGIEDNDDDADVLVKLARRVEERRAELGVVESESSSEDGSGSWEEAPTRRRRKRKAGPEE